MCPIFHGGRCIFRRFLYTGNRLGHGIKILLGFLHVGNEFDSEFCKVCHERKGGKMSGVFLIMLVGIGLIVVSFTALLLSQEPPDKPKLKYDNDFVDAALCEDD